MAGLKHVEVSELPNGIEDVVHLEEKDDHEIVPTEKENISLYLKEVDRTLWKSGLNKAKAPLVLAGVEYIVAIYKDISQYKYIMDHALTGSLENEDLKEIYRRTKEIISPIIV